MSAVDRVFARLRAAGRKAFVPFVTAGDPDLEFTRLLLAELARRGASLCEVGIPYSDPIADGPVIQASYTRALQQGVRLNAILKMLAQTTTALPAPLLTMVSYATVLRRGAGRYVEEARCAGVAGAIVPDLLVEESSELARLAREADFSLVHLVTPTTPRERARRIAERSTGFLYYVSVTGITGERATLPQQLVDNVGWLREQTPLPVCIGFGISQPEQVRLLAPVADGIIVGSAIVRRAAEAGRADRNQVLQSIGQYVQSLIDALPGTHPAPAAGHS
jgi:tryptophan synthase alpha chain